MFKIKNKDMKKTISLNKALNNALDYKLKPLLLVNGEYYDITKEVQE